MADGRLLPKRPSRRGRAARPTPVTAASFPDKAIFPGKDETLPGRHDPRPKDAWKVWRHLGEVHFSSTFMARQVGRLDWDVTIDGVEQDRDTSEEIIKLVTAPEHPAIAIRTMALHHQVAGQYLYVRHREDGTWRVVSTTRRAKKVDWLRELEDDADVIVHTIQRDPEKPKKADSPIMAALGTAEELMLLSRLNRSQSRNRVAQRGILLYPDGTEWPEGFDLADELEEIMTAPLRDEGHASSVVPPQFEVNAESIEKWRHLLFESAFDENIDEKIDAAIRRLALQLDHPPEVLLGLVDVTHWNAWHTDESTYRAHVEPMAHWPAQTLAEAIRLGADLEDAEVEVTPDPAVLLRRRPTVEDALASWDRGLVNNLYVINALGASEEDMPDGVDPDGGKPQQTTDPEPAPDPDEPPADPNEPPPGDEPPEPQSAAVPDDAVDTLGERLTAVDQSMLASVTAASELAVGRVRERIGARVRTLVRGDDALTGQIDGVDNGDVAATLGADVWGPLVDPEALAADTLNPFVNLFTSRVGGVWDEVQAMGVELPDGDLLDRQTEQATELLLSETVDHAVAGLEHRTATLPAPPTEVIRRAMAIAGGTADPVVATIGRPTLSDPGGLASSRTVVDSLRAQGVNAQQWRWVYGTGHREREFEEHRAQDGRFADVDGVIDGWFPGDHRGCQCALALVFTHDDPGGQPPRGFPPEFVP